MPDEQGFAIVLDQNYGAFEYVNFMTLVEQAARMNPTLSSGPRVTQDIQLAIGDSIHVGQHRVTVADVHGGDIRFHVETILPGDEQDATDQQPDSPK